MLLPIRDPFVCQTDMETGFTEYTCTNTCTNTCNADHSSADRSNSSPQHLDGEPLAVMP